MKLIDLGYEEWQSAITQQTEKEKPYLFQTVQRAVPDMDGFIKFLASIELNLKEYFLPRPSIIIVEVEEEEISTSDPQIKIIQQSSFNPWGIEDNSIQSIIVSPPYWNLKKYEIPDVIIGGNLSCKHKFVKKGKYGSFCTSCNAWEGQYGWEPTPELYIDHTLLWCQDAWRSLKKDGIFFLNFGDSYLDKCQLLIPERIAIALQDDGWILRNRIVWLKGNATPHPVKDRFSNKSEIIFFFVKSQKYVFNLDSVREPHKTDCNNWNRNKLGKNPGDVWIFNTQRAKLGHCAMMPEKLVKQLILCSTRVGDTVLDPFCGSATTLMVANQLGRTAYGIDLGYEEVQEQRLSGVQRRIKC